MKVLTPRVAGRADGAAHLVADQQVQVVVAAGERAHAVGQARQLVAADRFAHDAHERAGGQLRQMAQIREQAIVRRDVQDARHGAERLHERAQLLERELGRFEPPPGFD